MTQRKGLQRLLVFDGLTDSQLEKVAQCCREREYPDGERIFAHGKKADRLFVVLSGRVDLKLVFPGQADGDADTITSVRTNQVLGWSALTHSPIYTLSAFSAAEPCRLLEVDRDKLLALFGEDPGMGYAVMSNVAEVIRTRFHQLQEELARKKGLNIHRW
ncbi:MAG: cyclic nucleotide-binding domain-containing protein [Proteobacteria bacterium]|nr:cyclic nucleotide-binding domain-containing protein [Pseudomonadota bacterium]